jgi:hypothetical protein
MTLFFLVVGEGSVFPVKIDEGETVGVLKEEINSKKRLIDEHRADELTIYLAKKDGHWLPSDDEDVPQLQGGDVDIREKYCKPESIMNPTYFLSNYFSGDNAPTEKQIHGLVVVPAATNIESATESTRLRAAAETDSLEPRKKKAKIDTLVSYQGPVPNEFCCVPMDTITAYQQLNPVFHRPSTDLSRPLYLLYGPRQFGKTTVAIRLAKQIARDPSIEVIYYSVNTLNNRTEALFWSGIGRRIGVEISSYGELERVIISRRKRLCLFLDEMDVMFANQSLTSNFIAILRSWQGATFFHGFLGIGSYNLVNLYKLFKEDNGISPFNLSFLIKIEPFTIEQMVNFFDQISVSYDFTTSTRLAIMDYSSGAPGVFGSLIRFTIDRCMWKCEFNEWHSWFKIQNFTEYMLRYNTTYERIRSDLHHMSAEDWKALNYVLIHQNATYHSESNTLDFGNLLQMGVLIEAATGKLCFSSEMMRRICMEAQPVREIDQMLSEDSPLELLSVSLRWMRPDIIGHALVANRDSPSEAFFQFELYASTRGILHKHQQTRKVLAEARERGEKRRLDITISNGTSYGFELKSNKLTREEIEAAVEQADGYRRLLGIDTMFVVNFVPRIHVMDDVYHVDNYPDIKVIQICFPDTCDEYELKFLGENGEIENRVVQSVACTQ